jgi:hypothetical protein
LLPAFTPSTTPVKKFATSVVDTGGKLPPVSLKPAAILLPVSLTPVANLPPVSLKAVVHLDLRISARMFEKIQNGVLIEYFGPGGN